MMTEKNSGIDNPTLNFELDEQVDVSDTVAVIAGLETNKLYKFFVLAANEHGTSLPSSILTLNVTQDGIHFNSRTFQNLGTDPIYTLLNIIKISFSKIFEKNLLRDVNKSTDHKLLKSPNKCE